KGTIWSNDYHGEGYDIVLLGPADVLHINVDDLQQRLDREDYAFAAQSLEDVKFRTVLDLLTTYAGQGPDLAAWLKGAEINHDRNLRLQYLAGMGLNLYHDSRIFDDMVTYRRFPADL